MNVMEIRGLCKAYPAFTLKDVSFTVPQGAVMGFIGRNGAGKSTTIKSVLGLVHPDAGQVEILGRSFSGGEKFIKENIGVVLGGIDFYPKKTIATLTDVVRRFYENWDQEKYRHYLQLFAIDESKRVDQLSSGMKVKYLLPLALSHQAELLILDEPTSGLDPVSRDELLQIFSRIVKAGRRSILFSTHITSDLDRCADDITYIQRGRVRLSADKANFLEAFNGLQRPQDQGRLTLEDIMLRSEREGMDEAAL